MNDLILYAAVAPPKNVVKSLSWKAMLHRSLDRAVASLGSHAHLDYRKYIQPTSFNRGDYAISVATKQLVVEAGWTNKISTSEWKHLPSNLDGKSVLICGGGYFFIERDGKLASRIYDDVSQLSEKGIPYAIFGPGLNRPESGGEMPKRMQVINPSDRSIVSKLLNGASFVAVRDEQSRMTLQPLTKKPIFVSGDPALFLTSGELKHPIGPEKKASCHNIGINLPFHGPASNARIRKDLKQYIDFLKEFQRLTAAEFSYMVHFDSEVIIADILRDAGINLTVVNDEIPLLQEAYSNLDFHIGGMLHSCILACSVGTPCVALAYDVKHYGFFELMKIKNLCFAATPFDSETLLMACLQAFNNRNALRNYINNQRTELQSEAGTYLRKHLPQLFGV